MTAGLRDQTGSMPPQRVDRGCESSTTLSISNVITTSFTPISPGSVSQPAFLASFGAVKVPEIEPPARPRSTPFPQQEIVGSRSTSRHNDENQTLKAPTIKEEPHTIEQSLISSSRMTFADLPTEIHESILDYLFGVRGSTADG